MRCVENLALEMIRSQARTLVTPARLAVVARFAALLLLLPAVCVLCVAAAGGAVAGLISFRTACRVVHRLVASASSQNLGYSSCEAPACCVHTMPLLWVVHSAVRVLLWLRVLL